MSTPSPRDPARRRLCAALASLPPLAVGLVPRSAWASPALVRESRLLMGTRVDVVAQGDGAAAAARIAVAAAFDEMARLERMMSRYRDDNPLAELHRRAGRASVRLPAEMLRVLHMGQQAAQRSGGAFDMTVGAYAAWRFDGAASELPDAHTLRAQQRLVDHRQLQLDMDAGQAYLARPGMKLDLGGVAKLPILEAGMAVLQAHGIRNAMLNGGGDVRVSGRLEDRPWRIGLRDPRAPQQLIGKLELQGEHWVAASGDYERGFWRDGRYYHHVIDPASGQPSAGLRGVALVAPGFEAINGLGAALMVKGLEAGRPLLPPGADALLVPSGTASPWMTPDMARRLQA